MVFICWFFLGGDGCLCYFGYLRLFSYIASRWCSFGGLFFGGDGFLIKMNNIFLKNDFGNKIEKMFR